MKGVVLVAALALPGVLGAQQVSIAAGPRGRGAALIDSVLAEPHVVRSGPGRLELPRDSTVTTSVLVLGRPTYVASRVNGDVVVVGADLFLRPGAAISGRAVAVGGTVVPSTLAHVQGETVSLRDETFDIRAADGRVALVPRRLRVADSVGVPLFALEGLFGVGVPKYDRVDGLSLPLSGVVSLNRGSIALVPALTYRSRLGKVDPSATLSIGDTVGVQFVAHAARDTRTNDGWIYRDLINSLLTISVGTDTRNYFRSDLAEGRFIGALGGGATRLRPYLGGRYERVSPISATGTVFSFFGRNSIDHIARPNPLVEVGEIGSVLAGATFQNDIGGITSSARADVEQSVRAPGGSFTQVTLHGGVKFPTFGSQSLEFRGHAVATRGDSVPMARYAYLGGSGTLAMHDLLDMGGTELLFAESRYVMPLDRVVLPVVGVPTLTLRHALGSAGVGSLGPLQQEVGAEFGVGFSMLSLHFDYTVGAGGRSGSKFGVGLSVGL